MTTRTTSERGPSNLRQAHWGLTSQAVNTGSNFLLSVLVARAVTAAEFGAFAAVMVLYMVGLAIVRTTGNDVLAISYAGTPDLHRRGRELLTYACGIGTVFGLLCLGFGALLVGGLQVSYVVLAATFPLLFVQEAARGIAFARGAPRAAALNDFVRAAVQAGAAVAMVAATGTVSMTAAVLGWCAGGCLAALVGCLRLRALPARQWPHRWFVENRRLAAPLGASDVLAYLPANLTFILLPMVTALSELGVLRAAYLLFGPLGILILTLRSMILPDAARIGCARAVHRLLTRAAVIIGAVAVVWGVAVVALPDAVGAALLGDSWNGTFLPRVLLAVSLVAEAVMACGVAALGMFGLAGRIVRVQIVMAPLTLLLVLGLAAWYGADGAAAGFAACYWGSALLAWIQVPRGRNLDDAPVGPAVQPREMGSA